MTHGCYDEKDHKEQMGENLGLKAKTAINKSVYFIVGVCILGSISALYLFTRGFFNGWTKAKKVNVVR